MFNYNPYSRTAQKYDPANPGDFQHVPGEPKDPDPASWGMQPDGTFKPPAETPMIPRDMFIDFEGQLPYPDPNTYVLNTKAEAFYPWVVDTSHTWQAIWDLDGHRYMVHYNSYMPWNVYDITDPYAVRIVAQATDDSVKLGALSIQWNERMGCHIAIQARETPRYFLNGKNSNKYLDPTVEPELKAVEQLRGFKVWKVTSPNPDQWELLTEVSTDPNHTAADPVQEGCGVMDLPVYYGGDYLFVATAPDNTFVNQPYRTTLWTAGHQSYDVSDPTSPKLLDTWWVPGQRTGEEADSPYYQENPRWDNKVSWFGARMGVFMPRSVESGYPYAYAAMGGLGVFVLDVSDPANIKLVGSCALPPSVAGTEGDNIDVTQVEETGFIYASGYPMNTDCYEPEKEIIQIDVSDPAHPRIAGKMPRPTPPAGAPITDYAQRRGSFGPKRSGYYINPGKPHGKIIPYAYYNAGLQIFDVSDPANPKIGGYYVPPMGQRDSDDNAACVHGILVEWDRNIIWLMANTGFYAISTPFLGEVVTGLPRG